MGFLNLNTTDRRLRAVTVGTYPLGILFLSLHASLTRRVNPALGIAPYTFSAAMGVAMLVPSRKKEESERSPGQVALGMVFDFAIGCFLLTEAIVSYIVLENTSYWDRGNGLTMLGAWGANFLMINFVIHAFFFFRDLHRYFSTLSRSLYLAMSRCPARPTRCEHCNRVTFRGKDPSSSQYQPLMSARDEDPVGDYRDSEETVRNMAGPTEIDGGSAENLLKVDV